MKIDRSQLVVTVIVAFICGLFGSYVGHRMFSPSRAEVVWTADQSPPSQETGIGGSPLPCHEDAKKFSCENAPASEGGPLGCLLEFEEQLSPGCQKILAPATDRLVFCEKDIQSFCAGVKKGRLRIPKCLKAHANEISVRCAKALAL